jgi:hypothetical protein
VHQKAPKSSKKLQKAPKSSKKLQNALWPSKPLSHGRIRVLVKEHQKHVVPLVALSIVFCGGTPKQ